MTNCNDAQSIKRAETTEVFGHKYAWQAEVCKSCSKVIDNAASQHKYDLRHSNAFKKDCLRFLVLLGFQKRAAEGSGLSGIY
jgi:hypothetical protein